MDLSRRDFLKRAQGLAIGLSALSMTGAISAAMADEKRPPNVVFILADDLGWGDLKCYGHPFMKTPSLDKLAKQGVRFTQAYMSGSVCSPARAALTTGKYPSTLKIHGHIATHEFNEKRGMANWLDTNEATLPRLLQQSGYATAHIGKWHMGGYNDPAAPAPSEYGFDYTRSALSSDPNQLEILRNRPTSTKGVLDEAMNFIEQNKDKPFYVNAWLADPHSPLNPSVEQMDEYKWAKPSRWPELQKYEGAIRVYGGTVTEMDKQIGIFIDKLDQMGLGENTIVIFSSDNGPEDRFIVNASYSAMGSPGPFRGVKRSLYEGGIRVPMIVRWPGKTPANAVDNESVIEGVDLLPTICKLAGAKMPDGLDIDGVDMSDAFLGKPKKRKPLHWEWRFLILGRQFDLSPTLAMRDGNWKLLMNPDESRIELYDIVKDPGELNNLAEDKRSIVKKMKKELLSWHKTLPLGPSDQGAGSDEYQWPKPLE